jgi:stage II sporulation protein D
MIFLIIHAMTGCGGTPEPEADGIPPAPLPEGIPVIGGLPEPVTEEFEEASPIGAGLPISRAQAAKMLAFAYFDGLSITTMEREVPFIDSAPDRWYDKYLNAVYLAGLMSGDGESFMPDEWLTILQAEYLINALDPSNAVELAPDVSQKAAPISYSLWVEVFTQALKNTADGDITGVYGIEEMTVVPLTVIEDTVITDMGSLYCDDISLELFIDKRISVLAKDGSIVALVRLETFSPVIRNALIAESGPDSITVFSGGAGRTYALNGLAVPEGKVCDIKIHNGAVTAIACYGGVITGNVKRVTPEFIEIRDLGIFGNDPSVKVYDVSNGTPEWRGLADIIIGSDAAEYIVSGGVIRAVLITGDARLSNIRVLISASGYTGYLHDTVSLTSDEPFTVWAGGTAIKFNAGAVLDISPGSNADLFGNPRIYAAPDRLGGKIQLLSVSRNWPGGERPKYRGFIEIAAEPGGRYTVVNEVTFEEYLYAVIPSEMLPGAGLEAYKVQAVTARSYAYNHYFTNAYHAWGANVDDSVMCQVYNNIPENDISIAACDETRGMCLTYGGAVISANFYSTSAGVTANSGEVWANRMTQEFPAASEPYLTAVKTYRGKDYGSLSDEANAATFLMDTGIQGYDSHSPWFRWNVEMSAAELEASINSMLAARYADNPMMIKTRLPGGYFRSRPIRTIGALVDIEVTSRGEAGNITSMIITGTEAAIMVYTELNIRYLLKPQGAPGSGDITVNRHSGGGVSNFSLMPSAFFVMDKQYNELGALESAVFYGGGYGHGAGMSQYGVTGMIDAGYTLLDILQFYYGRVGLTRKY